MRTYRIGLNDPLDADGTIVIRHDPNAKSNTGFADSRLVWVGVLLAVAGALAVAMPRLTRRRS